MVDGIIVRRAKVEDIQDLADLAARSFRDTFEADNDPKNIEDYLKSSLTIQSVRNEIEDTSNLFLVACGGDDAALVGYAKLCTTSEDPSINDKNAVEIQRIYADKRVIGRGVGAALMRACLGAAEDLSCETIWLGVWEQNERAILFYERWEFKTVGARQFSLGPDLQNDLLMARQLN